MNILIKKIALSCIIISLLMTIYAAALPVRADWIDPRQEQFQTPYRGFEAFFPKCPPSRGEVVAYYPTGTHGIPGDFTTHTGADIVYALGNDNFLQCYCPEMGTVGIQVNWLSTGNLTSEEIDKLIQHGWYQIPNGADWGLAAEPYLTYNISRIMCVRPLAPRGWHQ
ncbi:MAG: hypothetical protein EPN88_15760 [Bacteroidetes bacterium]|nr:MAG: hypothetical protein EPN88_15760 [Bacteroidota bacterium]